MIDELQFDEATHTYTLNGRTLLSVTQVLKAAGLTEYLDRIPPDVLEKARQRGVAVHAACQFLDEGDLDWNTVHPSIIGYVHAWEKFKTDTGIVFTEIEKRRYHPLYLFAGTPDRVGILNGRPCIPDIKTYEAPEWGGIQTAGYEIMLRSKEIPLYDRYAVHLKDDGKYKITQYKDSEDGKMFMACLAVAQWKLKFGGK